MAVSVPLASPAPARAPRSISCDRRTGRKLLTAFLLARTSLLVLTGRASVDAACGGHDRHRVEHGYRADRRLCLVLAGSTDAVTDQRCFLVIGQDDDLAAFIAARTAVIDDVGTASTPTDDASLEQLRMPSLCPSVQQDCPVAQGAVDLSRAAGRQASSTVLLQENAAVRQHIRSVDSPLQADEGRGVRRAGSSAAPETMRSMLVVAALIGLLGVWGAAASIVHGITRPVSRAVRILQAPDKGRRGHRLRPTTLHELHDMSRAVNTAGDGPLRAAGGIGTESLSTALRGRTATPAPPFASAEEFPAPAGGASTDADRESSSETRSGVTVMARVVEQAQLVVLDATIGSALSGGADIGVAVIAPRGDEPVEVAAKAALAETAASMPAARSEATTRYAAARSRAVGPTTALWHAVDLDRLVGASGSACETTVCGSLVRVSAEQRWPVPARDICPGCSTLAH